MRYKISYIFAILCMSSIINCVYKSYKISTYQIECLTFFTFWGSILRHLGKGFIGQGFLRKIGWILNLKSDQNFVFWIANLYLWSLAEYSIKSSLVSSLHQYPHLSAIQHYYAMKNIKNSTKENGFLTKKSPISGHS